MKAGGADFLIIGKTPMRNVAIEIESASGHEILHICDPTGDALHKAGVHRVARLGTRFTMEQDFCRTPFADRFNPEVTTTDQSVRDIIHCIIYEELCLGINKPEFASAHCTIIDQLKLSCAVAVIPGCTGIA